MTEIKFQKRVVLNDIERAFSNGVDDFREWLERQPSRSTVGVATYSNICPIATYVIAVFGGVDRDTFLSSPHNRTDTRVAVGSGTIEVGLMPDIEQEEQREKNFIGDGEHVQTEFRSDMPRWAELFVDYIDSGGDRNATREEALLALNHAEDRIQMEKQIEMNKKYYQDHIQELKVNKEELDRLRKKLMSLI